MHDDFLRSALRLSREDPHFSPAAYLLVRDGLAAAVAIATADGSPLRHVSGAELSQGIRRVALRRYGPLARPVLSSWGLNSTLDFGKCVFALINAGVFDKSKDDSIDDFRDVFDFDTAFSAPFRPPSDS